MAEIRHEVRRGVHLLAAFLHCATTRRAVALCPCHFSFLPFVAAAVLTLTACSSDDDSTPSTPTQAPVLFQVNSVENATSSRSLIESKTPPSSGIDYSLQTACSPTGLGRKIGIWADYSIRQTDGSDLVFSSIFNNTSLTYQKRNDGYDNPQEDWNYMGDPLYWQIGGIYKFRAYYPQEQMKSLITTSASATSFVVEYPTATTQEDLLIAYNRVRTADRWIYYFGGKRFDDPNFVNNFTLQTPVPLFFKHAMAAMKFTFKFENDYNSTDNLTACWLENTDPLNLFANTGVMVYGQDDDHPETITWTLSYQPAVGNKMYEWVSSAPPAFDNAKTCTAYSTTASTGNQYAQNDGFLLVIPQTYRGGLRLCFTTQKGGSTVFSTQLPEATGTDIDGNTTSSAPYAYAAGKKYTYNLVLTRTDLKLNLTIADWNVRKHSDEIIF